jgi:DNA-binding response OmpR family regulator
MLLPSLEVRGPDGKEFTIELSKDRVTIGRFHEFNDVALEPDPQQLITRKAHCTLESDANGWWLVDNASINKTFLRREKTMQVVHGRTSIADGDIICVLGKLSDNSDPLYWELVFRDPLKTRRAEGVIKETYLEYDWVQAKLFRFDGSQKIEIHNLRPREHKLVRYMDQRNRANGNTPVMCSYEELIEAVWGDEPLHTEEEINHLVWELRQKIEPDPKEPRFLQIVRGLGYRMVTNTGLE